MSNPSIEPNLYETILPKVAQALVEINPSVNPSQIERKTKLIGDLNIDSLKIAELSVLLEESFDVPVFVPDLLARVDDPYELTVDSLCSLVQESLQEQGGN